MSWIGVDFDGTLAVYDAAIFPAAGAPIAPMVGRVRRWLDEGQEVRIVTARASSVQNNPQYTEDGCRVLTTPVYKFCMEHFDVILPVVAEKDFEMIELWDDRAVQVIPNEGVALRDILVVQERDLIDLTDALTQMTLRVNRAETRLALLGWEVSIG